jgi:hypothetical protein
MKNTRSTFSLLFYINTGKTNKSGRCLIVGRISVDGKNTAFSTSMDIHLAEWKDDLYSMNFITIPTDRRK